MNNSELKGIPATQQVEQTQIENLISRLQVKISHLEKAIAFNKDVFRQLDEVANKLNPDAFYKNHPQCESDSTGESEKNGVEVPQAYKSGIVLIIDSIIAEFEFLTNDIDIFTSYEVRNTVKFFTHQI